MVLDHHVRIGAAEAEGVDRRTPLLALRDGPGPAGIEHVERRACECDVLVELLEVDCRRQHAVLQRQQQLDDAGDAGGCKQVADVALDRADRAVAGLGSELAEGGREPLDLDRVAEPRAGAMRLDQLDLARVDAETAVGVLLQPCLRKRVGGGDAVGLAVLVDAPAADDADDRVTIAFCVLQTLEQHGADAFTRHEAVGALVEGVAAAVRRQHARLAGHDVHVRSGEHVDAAGQRHVAAPQHQAVAGRRQRHQR